MLRPGMRALGTAPLRAASIWSHDITTHAAGCSNIAWPSVGAVFDWVCEVPAGAFSRAAKCSVTAALSLVGLCKSFGLKRAVDHLDLEVRRGCMFGLVGPNGAGKTTTLSMATGLLRPDAGTARVLDHDVWADPAAAKALMGVLPDGLRLFDRLSGAELLRYVGLLRRVPPAEIATRSAELARGARTADDRDTLVVEYSAGMTKKIGLACALIHAPRLLILDEPFEAVDPVSGEGIRSILRNYAQAGRHGGHVQPCDGAGREPVRRAGRGCAGPGAGGRHPRRSTGGLQPAAALLGAGRLHSGGRGVFGVVALLVRLKLTLLQQQPAPQRVADRRADHRRWSTRWASWSRY